MHGPFRVDYIHHDGNAYEHGTFPTLPEAQRAAAALRETPFISDRRRTLPVVVTDLDDAERGDVSYVDVDEE